MVEHEVERWLVHSRTHVERVLQQRLAQLGGFTQEAQRHVVTRGPGPVSGGMESLLQRGSGLGEAQAKLRIGSQREEKAMAWALPVGRRVRDGLAWLDYELELAAEEAIVTA